MVKKLIIENTPFNGIQYKYEVPLEGVNAFNKPYIIRNVKRQIIENIARQTMPTIPITRPGLAKEVYKAHTEFIKKNIRFIIREVEE